MQRNIYAMLILALMALGCESSPRASQSNASGRANPSPAQPIAYVDGQPVSVGDLRTALLEAGGGQVLAEWVLDRRIEEMLARRGLRVGPTLRDAEQKILAQRLSDDPNEAQRLINELKQRRGLGNTRFQQLLHRSAAMRLLVQSEVQVSEEAIRQAYDLAHGPRYEARLIVTNQLAEAAQLVRQARAGESFIDLAIAHSTDVSRAQGGLLPMVSPADATFPDVIRRTLERMEAGQVSDPIALAEQGFAILKLERKIPADGVRLDDVRERLTQQVRLQVEDMLMRRMRATIIAESDIVILEPALKEGWQAWTRTNP